LRTVTWKVPLFFMRQETTLILGLSDGVGVSGGFIVAVAVSGTGVLVGGRLVSVGLAVGVDCWIRMRAVGVELASDSTTQTVGVWVSVATFSVDVAGTGVVVFVAVNGSFPSKSRAVAVATGVMYTATTALNRASAS
jgi:hypothetical protein